MKHGPAPRRLLLLASIVALPLGSPGCADEADEDASVVPSHGSMFGNDPVKVLLHADVGEVSRVSVGGVVAYELSQQGSTLTVKLQGAPSPGPAEVVIEGKKRTLSLPAGYTFDPPARGVSSSWVAFGASYTMGVQSDGLDPHSQTHGVAAQTARAAGVYLGLPLIKPTVLAPRPASDFGPDCQPKSTQSDMIGAIVAGLTDPTTKSFSISNGRVDPTLSPRNVAVGGARIHDVVHPATGQVGILEHIVEEPYSDLGQALRPVELSQLEHIERLDPDVGISSDLIGNDVLVAAISGDDLHPDSMTPLAQVAADLGELADRLGKLRGHYFIANVPSLSLLPNVAQLRARRIAAGQDTAQSFDQKAAALDAKVDEYNKAIVAAMGKHPNLHLVDFKAEVENFKAGLLIGGERLTIAPFGGLFSLDHLHLSDTGYAIYANVFVRTINAALGSGIAEVDVEAVHARDGDRPSALSAAGIKCVPGG